MIVFYSHPQDAASYSIDQIGALNGEVSDKNVHRLNSVLVRKSLACQPFLKTKSYGKLSDLDD